MFMFQVQLPPVRWSRKVHKGRKSFGDYLNYGVIQGFPALKKVVTTHVKKYDNFLHEFDIANQLLSLAFRATRSG